MDKVQAGYKVCDRKGPPGMVTSPLCMYTIWSWEVTCMKCQVVVKDESRPILCLLSNKSCWIKKWHKLKYLSPIFQPLPPFSDQPKFYRPPASWTILISCNYHFTTSGVPEKPDYIHNLVRSLLAAFHYIQLLYNTNTSDVQWFSTHSNATKGWWKEHGKATAKAKMPTSVINQSLLLVRSHIHGFLSENIWLLMLILKCLRHSSWEGMWPRLWCNLTWSSFELQLFTVPGNVAILQKLEFHVCAAVGSIVLIGVATVWKIPQPNEQLEVGQPPCLCRSSRPLQSANNMVGHEPMP